MKTLYLIINPNAGTRVARRFLPEMISVFNRENWRCSVYVTEKRGDAAAFALAHGDEADLLVACGGDGTLNEVASGIMEGGHRPLIGYVPCGSTNDFAVGLGLSTRPVEACERIVSGVPAPLDLGLFAPDRYFTYTASFGAFTRVSWSTSQTAKNVLGHVA